jgi:copper oxidase (laccase) domain-containing protein
MFHSKRLSKFKKIKHCFFSKKNGFSKGLYKSLNCGKGSKDKKKKYFEKLNLCFQKNVGKKK